MSSWTIYGKDGQPKHLYQAVADNDGNIVSQDTLELHDEWMGENFLTVSIHNSEPIDFAVGDYIDYRDERYTIEYDPTMLKKAIKGTYGEGFTYENIKFVNEAQAKIVRCDFTDIVLNPESGANKLHYTALPTFPFYCETVDDLLDRIQANLEELYPGEFTIIGLNRVRAVQRGDAVSRQNDFAAAYDQYIGGASDSGNVGVAMTVDNINCWNALTKVHEEFGLNFIVRGYTVIVGSAGVYTSSKFRFGKKKGLYEIERIGDSEQQIVTRLKAYGSENNLPVNYYADLHKTAYMTGRKFKWEVISGQPLYSILTNISVDQVSLHIDQNPVTVEIGGVTTNGTLGYRQAVTGLQSDGTGWSTDNSNDTDYIMLNLNFGISNPDAESIFNSYDGGKIYIKSGVSTNKWNPSYVERIQNYAEFPEKLVINRLMLPGFPDTSLYDWAIANGWDSVEETTNEVEKNGYHVKLSKDITRPYIESMNTDLYGIRPGSIYFDGSNDTEEICPTIKNTGHDTIVSAEQIADTGVFEEGTEPKKFWIKLPDLNFNLLEYFESGASIDMIDGMCGGRSFKIESVDSQNQDGSWTCHCVRDLDNTLHIYYPYNDFQINADGRQDHYVLTGITLPKEYVDAAAAKLFDASIDALQKNDAPRFTYQPRIDEIWMAFENDRAHAANPPQKSLHDTLKAGDIFQFEDADIFGVDGEGNAKGAAIIIDQLTIKENGNNGIPTYEVTLREEKHVSTIQKLQNKIDSLSAGGNGRSAGGSGSGVSSATNAQIESLIQSAGKDYFLSKTNDDAAHGLIGFLKGIWVGVKNRFGWTAEGDITARRVQAEQFGVEQFAADKAQINEVYSDNYDYDDGFNGSGFIVTKWKDGTTVRSKVVVDDLTVRGQMTVNKLEIREETYTGGNQHWSPAGSVIFRVDYIKYQRDGQGNIVYVDGHPVEETLGYTKISTPWTLNGVPFLTGNFTVGESTSIALTTRRQVAQAIGDEISEVDVFRNYIVANNGTTATRNFWCVGDLARCQTYNIVTRDERDGEEYATGAIQTADPLANVTGSDGNKTMQNVFYWRRVSGVGSKILEDGKPYNYIDFPNKHVYSQGMLVKTNFLDGSDIPAMGDTIVCFGNDQNIDRMGIISAETYNGAGQTEETPAIKMYAGVNGFSTSGKRTAIISPGKVEFRSSIFRIITDDGSTVPVQNPRGTWQADTAYHYYDVVQHNGSSYLCVIDDVYMWIDGDKTPSDQSFDWETFDPATMLHEYSYGVLDAGETGFDGSKGHKVGDSTVRLTLVYNFTTIEPGTQGSESVWSVIAAKGDKGEKGDDGTIDETTIDKIVSDLSALVEAGLTLIIEPQVIIVSQTSKSSSSSVSALSGSRTAKVRVLRNGVKVPISLVSNSVKLYGSGGVSGGEKGTAIGDVASDELTITLNTIESSLNQTTGRYEYVDDNGIITFTIIADNDTDHPYTLSLKWYLNRLGSRIEETEGDLKTELMSRTEYSLIDSQNLLEDTVDPKLPTAQGAVWSFSGNGVYSMPNVSPSPATGFNKSFLITGNVSGYAKWRQSCGFWNKDTAYRFTAWVRAGGSNTTMKISVSDGTERAAWTIIVGTSWQAVSVPFVLSQEFTGSTAHFEMGVFGSGTIEILAPCLTFSDYNVIKTEYNAAITSSASLLESRLQQWVDGQQFASQSQLSQTALAISAQVSTINVENLMRGATTGLGWIRYYKSGSRIYTNTAVYNKETGAFGTSGSYIYLASPSVYLEAGQSYCLTYFMELSYGTTYFKDILYNPTQSAQDSVIMTGSTVSVSKGSITEKYGSYDGYYVRFTAPSSGYYVFVWGDSEGQQELMYCPMLVEGSTACVSSTAMLSMTAKKISLGIQNGLTNTGIDIANRRIDMTADRFTLRNNSGEQTVGVDESGNVEISGTVRAKNLFHNVLVFTEGGIYSNSWYYISSLNDWTRSKGYSVGDYINVTPEMEGETGYSNTGLQHCSYDADIIQMTPAIDNWTGYKKVMLPDPKDFYGKYVEVFAFAYSTTNKNVSVGCVVGSKMSNLYYYDTASITPQYIVANPDSAVTVRTGTPAAFVSVRTTAGAYFWVKFKG